LGASARGSALEPRRRFVRFQHRGSDRRDGLAVEPAKEDFAMKVPMRFLVCASAVALILGAAPTGSLIAPARAQVAVAISAGVAPPLLPVYAQPPIPGPGYLWIPGYWAWDGQEYYWVPGYWAMPPAADLLWTPPYWAWNDGAYDFYPGYWAPTVGFYGGVDYGFGYTGVGYDGGYWQNNQFFYNTAVNNLAGAQIANTYSRAVPAAANHVSFTGGAGGIAARDHARPPTAEQTQHQELASRDQGQRFNANQGRPPTMAMQRANELHGAGAEAATHAAAQRPHAATGSAAARPEVAEHARTGTPRIAEHAPAAQRFGYRGGATRAPAARQHFAYHAPATHAPMARNFAYRPQAAHVGGAAHFGGMRMGGAPHFASAPHFGGMGGMHMGGAPHFAGAPHIGGMGGGMHMGGMHPSAPHMGGGGPRHVP
jgi:hypothetical protein